MNRPLKNLNNLLSIRTDKEVKRDANPYTEGLPTPWGIPDKLLALYSTAPWEPGQEEAGAGRLPRRGTVAAGSGCIDPYHPLEDKESTLNGENGKALACIIIFWVTWVTTHTLSPISRA